MDGRIQQKQQVRNRPSKRRAARQRVLPALLAGSACGLAAGSAQAIQLGEIDVQSSLGQPLRASIAYALSPNEQIGDYCIFLRRGAASSGLPSLSNAKLTVANGRINIVGSRPIREPMLDIGLSVNCPYTANLTRSYTVMLDPYQPAPVAPAQPAPVATTATPRPAVVRPTPTTAVRTPTARAAAESIGAAGEYRVRVGDSLSEIASRIENRPGGLWETVDLLFSANPDAFIDGDVNRLKAGSVLTIPSFDGVNAPSVRVADSAPPAPTVEPTPVSSPEPAAAYSGVEETVSPSTPATTELPTPVEVTAIIEEPQATVDSFAETGTSVVDTTAEPTVTPPVVQPTPLPTIEDAPSAADGDTSGQRTALFWIAGTGFALIALLLLFGRRFRSKGTGPGAPEVIADTAADPTAADEQDAVSEVDFEIGGQPSTEYAVALDADLSAGTGLTDGSEIEVAQDFGFSASDVPDGKLDMTLNDDTTIEEKPSTDILPTRAVEENTILEKEILPSDVDDDYDMSVIVDATKQKFGEGDITAKDLMAVAIAETESDEESDDEYTLSREIDYKILEQDYEDELTATQALNAEIEKAAKELADRLDDDVDALADETQETLAITAETRAVSEEPEVITDLDDTGINEELTAEMPQQGVSSVADATAEVPVPDADECGDDTAANTEITEKLPAAENDPTAEMDVESGHFRTGRSGR